MILSRNPLLYFETSITWPSERNPRQQPACSTFLLHDLSGLQSPRHHTQQANPLAPHPLAVWHHNRNLAQNNNVFWLILLVKFSIRNELDMKKGAQDDHSEAVEVFTKKKGFKMCEPSNKKSGSSTAEIQHKNVHRQYFLK